MTDFPDDKCVVCGNHRNICCYPPVCKNPHCLDVWEIETDYNKQAEEHERIIKEDSNNDRKMRI